MYVVYSSLILSDFAREDSASDKVLRSDMVSRHLLRTWVDLQAGRYKHVEKSCITCSMVTLLDKPILAFISG